MSDIKEQDWIEEVSDKVVAHMQAIMEENVKVMEYEDLFTDMGIGRGIKEYERGMKMLREDATLNDKQFRQAIKQLVEWCEV